jgi:protein involved in polysaccharide export with SLBB domain
MRFLKHFTILMVCALVAVCFAENVPAQEIDQPPPGFGLPNQSKLMRVKPTGGDVNLDPRGDLPLAERGDGPVYALPRLSNDKLLPFGSQLFTQANLVDRSIGVSSNYVISPGDRIAVKIWGVRTFEDVQAVDSQGNIFLPEIGSIKVAGVTNALLASVVKQYVGRVFTDNVNIYTNLLGTQPISVYVTGAVKFPGRYPGSKVDSILYYLSRAGSIDPKSGTYRSLRILREGQEVANVDLYRFLLLGELLKIEFQNNDTIVVPPQSATVTVAGEAKNTYIFEFDTSNSLADELVSMAQPNEKVSHARIKGVRDGESYSTYVSLDQLKNMALRGGDVVTFMEDYALRNLTVNVVGNSRGVSSFVVPTGASLEEVARLVEIDPKTADLNSIYLRRASVAQRQKDAIHRSLYELQRSVLTGSSSSNTESSIRVQEAELVEKFVSKVFAVEPEGRVVLAGADWGQVKLEDGDEIIIPELSDVVVVSGEVKIPLTILWKAGHNLNDYIGESGGVSNRGDLDNILVLKRNGSVNNGKQGIEKGDHIMVLPKDDTKAFAMFKDIVEVIYRVAVSSSVLLSAID